MKWNRNSDRIEYLFTHSNNDIRITATDISNSEIYAFVNMNPKQTQQVLHEELD